MGRDSPMRSNYGRIAGWLKALRTAWRINAASQGLLLAVLFCTPLIIIGALAGVGAYYRTAVLALSLSAGILLLLLKVLYPAFVPLKLKDVSLLAERRERRLENMLTTAVELWPAVSLPDTDFEAGMLSSLFLEAASAAGALKVSRIINLRRTALLFTAVLVLCFAYAVCFSAFPDSMARLAAFVTPPFVPAPDVYAIEWVSGDMVVQSGSPAVIRARLSGQIKSAPVVILEREGLDPARKPMLSEKGLAFNLQLASVTGETTYYVTYGNRKSGPWRITPVEPPRVQALRVKLVYPKYTGTPPEERENSGDITAIYGSMAEIDVTSSSPLGSAYIVIDGKKKQLSLSGNRAAGSLRVERDSSYSIRLADKHGFPNRLPPVYSIRAISDAPPQIELLQPKSDLTIPGAAVVFLKGDAKDDYGISSVTLHYRVTTNGKSGAVRIPVRQGTDAPFELPWDLAQAGAFQGDVVEYSLSASDNDPFNGPKSAYTPTLKITIMSTAQDYAKIEQANDLTISRLESAVTEAQDVSQTFKTLAQNLSNMDAAQWQKNTDVKRTMDRQQALENELSDITDRMRQNVDHMQDNELVSTDTLQKMNEIQKLMEQISTKEMKDLLDKIQKSVQDIDTTKLDRSLLDSLKDQEKLIRNLDNTLQRLKRIQAEQKMSALAKQLKELTGRQKQALDESGALKKKQSQSGLDTRDRQNLDQLSREEKNIRDSLSEAKQKLDDLRSDLSKMSPDSTKQLDKMLNDYGKKRPDSKLQQASDNMKREKMQPAVENADDAYQSMLALSSSMKEMSDSFSSRMSEAAKKMVMRVLNKTLDLSQAQEQTLDAASELASRPGRQPAISEAQKLTSDIRFQRDVALGLASDISLLAAMTMSLPPDVITTAIEAGNELDAALNMLKENRPNVDVGPGDIYLHLSNSYKDLNRVALALLDAKNGGQGSGGQTAMDQFMKQLQAMADAQENINGMTQQLGSSGLPIPSQNAGLQALAVQQQMVKDSLSKLISDTKGMGEMGKRLEQIQQKMEEIQRELSIGNAGSEVQRRQSDVLRRLKDATLSLRKETLEENRVSESGHEYAPPAPEYSKDTTNKGLPADILNELNSLKKESRLKGYENAIDSYYKSLQAPK